MSEEFNKKEENNAPVPYVSRNESEETYKIVTADGRPKTLGWSVASLVFAVFSVIFSFVPWLAIVFGVLAVGFSLISRKKLGYFSVPSVIGLIIGIFGAVLGVGVIIVNNVIDPEFINKIFS